MCIRDRGECPPGHSIDRFPNNDGNYEPGNCRWANRTEQNRNTRQNVLLTFKGETMTMSAWAERIGCKYRALANRVAHGWSTERALTEPFDDLCAARRSDPRRERIAFNGESLLLVEWAERLGIRRNVLWHRIAAGWPIERALTAPIRPMARRRSAA